MNRAVFLFLFISLIYTQTINGQKPKFGYAGVNEKYAEVSSSQCTLDLAVSLENGPYTEITVQNFATQISSNSLKDGYRYFILNVIVPLGEGVIDLVLETTDTLETFLYPNVAKYNCSVAPTLVADTFNYHKIFPYTKNKIPLRLVGYNRISSLQITSSAQSPYTIIGLAQDPYDLSLFYISTSLRSDTSNFPKSFTVTITETSDPSNTLTLDYDISFKDFQISNISPMIYPNPDLLNPIKTSCFSIFVIEGDMKNQVIQTVAVTPSSLMISSKMLRVKGNDLDCTVFLISKVNFITYNDPLNIHIYGYQNFFIDSFTVVWPSRPSNVFSNPVFDIYKADFDLPNLGDIKWTYTFNPIYYPFTPSFSSLYNDGNNEYPFGIASGNLNVFQTIITEYFESYLPDLSQSLETDGTILFMGLGNTQIDSTPPLIHNITFTKVPGAPYYHVRVHVTDDLSGFYKIVFGQFDTETLYYFNNLGDDIYEGVFRQTYSLLYIFDRAGNSQRHAFYLPNGVALPENARFTTNMITHFRFASPVVDLQNSGFNNTLYFNYTGAGIGNGVIFVLDTKEFLDLPSISNNPTMYDYDPELKMYKIDFYMEQGLYAQNVSYLFGSVYNPYSDEQLIPILGDSAVLTIVNNYANQIPPIITSISQYPAPMNQINNQLETLDIGWTIEIDTQSRYLAFAQFNVTS
ncbi:hypothetical protein CYY_009077, partial [Polysphondylium violaceum]